MKMKWLRMFALGGMLFSAPSFGFAEEKTQNKPVKTGLQQSVGQITQIDAKQRQITLAPQAQQVQVQQDGGKRGEGVSVFAVNDVTLIGTPAKKGMKGKPTQEDPAVKPKVKPNPGQDVDVPTPKVKPTPGQDVDQKPTPKVKPNPGQDDPTPTPKVKPTPGQDVDVPAPKVKPTPGQDEPTPKVKPNPGQDEPTPKVKPNPGQDVDQKPTPKVKPNPGQDVDQKPTQEDTVGKPTQGQFEQLKVGQVVRVRYAKSEDATQTAIEIVVLKDAP